jgi:hypothetical protein
MKVKVVIYDLESLLRLSLDQPFRHLCFILQSDLVYLLLDLRRAFGLVVK